MDFGEMIVQALLETAVMVLRLFGAILRGLMDLKKRDEDQDA